MTSRPLFLALAAPAAPAAHAHTPASCRPAALSPLVVLPASTRHPPAAPPASYPSLPTSLSRDVHGHRSGGDGYLLVPRRPWPPEWGRWRAASGEPTHLPSLPTLSSSRVVTSIIWRRGGWRGSDEVGGEGSRSEASLPLLPRDIHGHRSGGYGGRLSVSPRTSSPSPLSHPRAL